MSPLLSLPNVPMTGSAFEGIILPVAVSVALVLFAGSKFLERYQPLREQSIKEATRARDAAERRADKEKQRRIDVESGQTEALNRLREELTAEIDKLREEIRKQAEEFSERERNQQREHRQEMRDQEERHRREKQVDDDRHAEQMTEREQRIMRLIADKFTLETFITSGRASGGNLPEGLMADASGLPLPGTPTS